MSTEDTNIERSGIRLKMGIYKTVFLGQNDFDAYQLVYNSSPFENTVGNSTYYNFT